MMMIRFRSDGWALAAAIVLSFLMLFLVYPVMSVSLGSVASSTPYSLFFRKAYYYQGLINSLWLSGTASLGAVVLGVPLAVLVSRYAIPLKGLIRTTAILSLLSPPFVGAYAWVLLLGRSGFLTGLLHIEGALLQGANRVLVVFILHHFAYVFLLVSSALACVEPSLEEAAETMGVGPVTRLFTITLPLVGPSILAGAVLVFTSTLADFGTPMLIGDGVRTLPILAYNEFINEMGGDIKMASAISLIMLIVALAVLALSGWVIAGRSYAVYGVRRPAVRSLPVGLRWLGTGFALGMTIISSLPQFVILVASFMHQRGPVFTGEFGLENYHWLWRRMGNPLTNTLAFSVIAAVIMLLGGMVMAYILVRRSGWIAQLLDGLLTLAHILPGTVLAVGLLMSWSEPPLLLAGTATILVIAYIVRRIAFTVRAAAAGLRQLSPCIDEASLALGASPLRTFRYITAPLMLPTAVSGTIVSWVSTLNELSSTVILYTGRTSTLSIQIYNQVLADHFSTAAALSTVLMMITLASLWLTRVIYNRQEFMPI